MKLEIKKFSKYWLILKEVAKGCNRPAKLRHLAPSPRRGSESADSVLSSQWAYANLQNLVTAGYLKKAGHGEYTLTVRGKRAI